MNSSNHIITSTTKLMEIFKLRGDRTLKTNLVGRVSFTERGVEVSDEKLVEFIRSAENDEVLSTKEAASEFNTTPARLVFLAQTREIPSFKVNPERGSTYLFLRSDLEKFNNIVVERCSANFRFREAATELIQVLVPDKDRARLVTEHYVNGRPPEAIANDLGLDKSTISATMRQTERRMLAVLEMTAADVHERERLVFELKSARDQITKLEARNRMLSEELGIRLSKEKDMSVKVRIPIRSRVWDALPKRVKNFMLRHDIDTIAELSEISRQKLNRFRNMGEKTINEIEKLLADNGLSLKEHD